jgi:hypothetical protein
VAVFGFADDPLEAWCPGCAWFTPGIGKLTEDPLPPDELDRIRDGDLP